MRSGFVVWLTGLPASGKTTLAKRLRVALVCRGYPTFVLDGDEIRRTLWPELGFSREARDENIRRMSHLAKMLAENGIVAIVAVISPYRRMREYARSLIPSFVEVYLSCPVEVCEKRDAKGMYERAKRGEIPYFTGISDPYEPPLHPELTLETDTLTPNQCLQKVLWFLQKEGFISSSPVALNAPHGGELVQKFLTEEEKEKELREDVPRITVAEDYLMDAENIAQGVYSPLQGFLSSDEVEEVLDSYRLPNGLAFGIPVFLPITSEQAKVVENSPGKVVLQTEDFREIALMKNIRVEQVKPEKWAKKMFETEDQAHPGVARLCRLPPFLLSGEVYLIQPLSHPFSEWSNPPIVLREEFLRRGWRKVCAFQTRNPPHRGHEFLHRLALDKTDGLLVHPILGTKKEGDFATEVILRSYQLLFRHYLPQERVFLSGLSTWMRYGGPREAIFHAVIRKNFGCSHFIVGRDHAGVGDYYPPYAAQEIFDRLEVEIEIIPVKSVHFCRLCDSFVTESTCPHSSDFHENISMSAIKKILQGPSERVSRFLRPEIAQYLSQVFEETARREKGK
ncbi:MAG: adenylyl-sulfate kinase [bacterium JZ-2024 1]